MTDATFRNLTVNNELFLNQSNTTLSHLNERTLSFSRNREFYTTYIRSDILEVTRAILSRTSVSAPLITATNLEVSNSLLVNGVPVGGVEGITILVSGNQTTFQRDGVSSSIRFRVFDHNNTATNMLFRGATSVLPGELNVPTRIFLSHAEGHERHLFTSYISFIDVNNVDGIQSSRHHAVGNAYFIENMRDGGSITLRARLGPVGGSTMTTMLESTTSLMKILPESTLANPSVLQIGERTRIDQIVPPMDGSTVGTDVPMNNLRRTLIKRTLLSDDQYHAGSAIPGLQVIDGGLFNRGMYINPNASQSSLNNLVQLNDVVMGGLGQSSISTKAVSFTCWANMALGVRIFLENINDVTTGTVSLRANNTQLVIHSGSGFFFNAVQGYINTLRPIRFNGTPANDRAIENLTTLSFSNDSYTGSSSLNDMTMKVVNFTNSTNFTSHRSNMTFLFQTKTDLETTNRFIISPNHVTVQRVNFRTLSPSLDSLLQRQLVLRCEDSGDHRIQCTNAVSNGSGDYNHFIVSLGRSNGSGGIIEEDVFTFRGGANRHTSSKGIRLPEIQFSADDSVQTTAFTNNKNSELTANTVAIANLQSAQTVFSGILNDHATSLSNIGSTIYTQQTNGEIGSSAGTLQQVREITLVAGTYIISYNVYLVNIYSTTTYTANIITCVNTTSSIPTAAPYSHSKVFKNNISLPHAIGTSQLASFPLTLTSTTTIRLFVALSYSPLFDYVNFDAFMSSIRIK